jgi:hypothetical protein
VCEHNSRKRIPSHFVNEVASIAVVEDQVSRAGEDRARLKLPRGGWMEAQRQSPNLFCINRRKDSAPREFQSCMGSLRCRAEGCATRPTRSPKLLSPPNESSCLKRRCEYASASLR